ADFGPLGIRVNAIAPGEIDTAILSPGTEEIVAHQIPMHRLGTPDEVAKIIYVLCTETSSYVNGAEIHINGGQHVYGGQRRTRHGTLVHHDRMRAPCPPRPPPRVEDGGHGAHSASKTRVNALKAHPTRYSHFFHLKKKYGSAAANIISTIASG